MNLDNWYNPTQAAKTKQLDNLIYPHPLFGESGKPAPISAHRLADMLGCTPSAISARRKLSGVLPLPVENYAPTKKPPRRPRLPLRVVETARLFESWKRPTDMDVHLKELKDALSLTPTRFKIWQQNQNL